MNCQACIALLQLQSQYPKHYYYLLCKKKKTKMKTEK